MPAAPATHIEALRRYGTISFEQAATPAMELARDGYAVYPFLANNLNGAQDQYRRWPDSARIFLPGGRPPQYGELFRQEDLGRSIAGMIEAERARARRPRQETARGARFLLPRPDRQRSRRLSREERRVSSLPPISPGSKCPVEDSISINYRGYEVHACDVWCQGITLLETLKIIEGCDLNKLGHNSPDYVHTVTEALNLAVRRPRSVRGRSEIREGADRGAAVGCVCGAPARAHRSITCVRQAARSGQS